jgi:hypothetical protein
MTMKSLATMLSAGAVALMLSGSAWAAGDAVVSPAQIEAAKTSADHEAIAAAYDKEATRFAEMAKDHEAMATSYRAASVGTKGANAAAMSAHCSKLVTTYKQAAEENRQLAAEHRAMAKAAGK